MAILEQKTLNGEIVAVTANKTLALTDRYTLQRCDNAADIAITVPTNASVGFPYGNVSTEIVFFLRNTGDVTINAASGVTVRKVGTTATTGHILNRQYTYAKLVKVDIDEWVLITEELLGGDSGGSSLAGERKPVFSASEPGLSDRPNVVWFELDGSGNQIYPFAWIWDSTNSRWVSELQEVRANLNATGVGLIALVIQSKDVYISKVGYRIQPSNNAANEIQIASTVINLSSPVAQNATGIGVENANISLTAPTSIYTQVKNNGASVNGNYALALSLFYIR